MKKKFSNESMKELYPHLKSKDPKTLNYYGYQVSSGEICDANSSAGAYLRFKSLVYSNFEGGYATYYTALDLLSVEKFIPWGVSLFAKSIKSDYDVPKTAIVQYYDWLISRIDACNEWSFYENAVNKCAMYAAVIIFRLGLDDWSKLSSDEKLNRLNKCLEKCCSALEIPQVSVYLGSCDYYGKDFKAAACAHADTKTIEMIPRCLIQDDCPLFLLFHELGHHVQFAVWDENNKGLREKYGLSDEDYYKYKNNIDNELEVDADSFGNDVSLAFSVLFDIQEPHIYFNK